MDQGPKKPSEERFVVRIFLTMVATVTGILGVLAIAFAALPQFTADQPTDIEAAVWLIVLSVILIVLSAGIVVLLWGNKFKQ